MATAKKPDGVEEFRFPDESPSDKTESHMTEIAGDDDVEVEIVDDTPDKDKGRKPLEKKVDDPTDEEIEGYTENVKKRINELTHARHDERRNRETAERERDELARLAQAMHAENQRLKQTQAKTTETLGGVTKAKAEADLKRAREELKAAQEAFDTDRIVAAQEALADAKLALRDAERFSAGALQASQDAVQTAQVTRTDATAAQPQRVQPDAKALRWQAKNQWFGQQGFEDVTSFALGLHQKLVSSGLDPRSDDYYEQVDARLKAKFPEVFGEQQREDADTRSTSTHKKPSSVVAPATRSSGVQKIRLTQSQLRVAQKLGLSPQQYAAQVAALEKAE